MKKLIYTSLFLLGCAAMQAQGGIFSMTYDISFPMGETSDVVSKTSWRGGTLVDGRAFITDNITVGGSFGWHVFTSKEEGTFQDGNISGTGTLVNTINVFPLLATGHYYFGTEFDLNPYVGLGIGTSNVTTQTDFGLFTDKTTAWEFALAPQVGVLVPLNYNVHGNVKLTYNYAMKAGDARFNTSYLSLGIGLAWYK